MYYLGSKGATSSNISNGEDRAIEMRDGSRCMDEQELLNSQFPQEEQEVTTPKNSHETKRVVTQKEITCLLIERREQDCPRTKISTTLTTILDLEQYIAPVDDKDVEEGQRQDMEVMEEQIYNEGGTVLGVVDVLDRSTRVLD